MSADTGGRASRRETDPIDGGCVNPAAGARAGKETIGAAAASNVGFFVTGEDDTSLDPALNNRAFERFIDSAGASRGITDVSPRSLVELLAAAEVSNQAVAALGGEVNAVVAVLRAPGNGYTLRWVVDAVVAGALTVDGQIPEETAEAAALGSLGAKTPNLDDRVRDLETAMLSFLPDVSPSLKDPLVNSVIQLPAVG